EAIARIPQLPHLAAPPATTDLGVRHLADLPELRTLSLIDTQVSGSTLSVFAAHPLEVLWLQNTPLTSDGVQQVGDLHQLRRLSVANTQITDDDFHALATLLELDYLDISETSVGDAGILHLLPLPRLYVIDAYQTQITPAAVHSFQQQHPDIQFCTGIRSGTENSPPRASASPPGHPRKPAKVVDPGV
ncbi:MAG TPA: hypothetical protein DCY79_24355, partial [Planctomycetaceae bacterium]|nr:hypothetical protein [Planctomycetaceae bacterium]